MVKMMTEETKDDIELTESDVWDVIKFSRSMSGLYGNQFMTPDMINSRLKDISLNPMEITQVKLDNAMKSPKDNESILQKFSQELEIQSMVYKRLMTYLSSMLSFDITYTSDVDEKEFDTPRYRSDLKLAEDFLEKFEYKKELRIVVRELLRNDAYFGCFVETKNKYILQELPSEYCKITGRWEGGFLFSFDMSWFMQSGVDINMYPSFFKRKYNQLWGSKKKKQRYIPSISPELRRGSSWTQWVDIPTTFGVCFKLSPELATRLPYFLPLFNDLVLQGLMRNLQKNANMAAASKMIMGEVPMLNKDAKASVRDSIAISPELLGKFMALVKAAVSSSIRVASAPLQNITPISFDSETDIYESYLRTTLASSGINTNLLFTSDVKTNSIETQLSLNVDEQMMTSLYEQFNYFMDYFINKRTKRFKFTIAFEGTEFFLNRQDRFETAVTLFNMGMVLPQKIAAAIGMRPSQFRKQLESARLNKFLEKITPPSVEQARKLEEISPTSENKTNNPISKKISTKDAPGVKAKRGRPLKKDSELDDEGQETRDGGGNLGRGGTI